MKDLAFSYAWTKDWISAKKVYSILDMSLANLNIFSEFLAWVKSRQGRKLQFSDRQLQISDRVIMGAQNFNFAPKFPQNIFSILNLALLDENFLIENFLTAQNLAPPWPRRHWSPILSTPATPPFLRLWRSSWPSPNPAARPQALFEQFDRSHQWLTKRHFCARSHFAVTVWHCLPHKTDTVDHSINISSGW